MGILVTAPGKAVSLFIQTWCPLAVILSRGNMGLCLIQDSLAVHASFWNYGLYKSKKRLSMRQRWRYFVEAVPMCVLHVKLRTNKMKCNTYVCTHIFFTKVLKPALATVTTATVPTVSDALHTKWHMHQSSLFWTAQHGPYLLLQFAFRWHHFGYLISDALIVVFVVPSYTPHLSNKSAILRCDCSTRCSIFRWRT